jgi:multidrug efflux pump subunit AcrA (membrane-fusion protein)
MKTLESSGAASAREVEDIAYQLRTAKTTLREATKTYGETRVTAPFAGVVAARDVKVGEQVSSAARAFQIVDLSELRVNAQLPERDVSKVAVDQPARLVSAYDTDQTARATVTRISPVIDATSGTFLVTLTLDADQNSLRPGQFVSVELEVDRREDVLVVPKEAVLYDNGMPVVYRMVEAPEEEDETEDDAAEDDEPADDAEEGDTTAEQTEDEDEDEGPKYIAERVVLQLGLTDVTTAEVVKGLSKGDRIVVVGHTSLKDGARIREPSEEATPSAQADLAEEGDEG